MEVDLAACCDLAHVQKLSVKELKTSIKALGGNMAGCLEKTDLQERLVQVAKLREAQKAKEPKQTLLHGLLNCIVSTGGAQSPTAGVLSVILLHGYGANKEDLAPVGEMALSHMTGEAEANGWLVRFIVPDAPASIPGGGKSRQWWPIDMYKLMTAAMANQLDVIFEEDPDTDSNSNSTDRVRSFAMAEVAHVREKHGIAHRLVLSGFSQGGMLAANVCLKHWADLPELRAACLFSVSPITKSKWKTLATALAARQPPLAIFQSHGVNDRVIPFHVAKELNALFLEAGLPVDFVQFNGDHTIGEEPLQRYLSVLSSLVSST